MPRFYCDYCQVSLTHDSPSVRRSHQAGWKHRMHVQNYYTSIPPEDAQKVLNDIAKAYEGYNPLTDPTLRKSFSAMGAQYPMPPIGSGIRVPPPGWTPPHGHPLLPGMPGGPPLPAI